MVNSYWKSILTLEKKGRKKREGKKEGEREECRYKDACRNTALLTCSLQNSSPRDCKLLIRGCQLFSQQLHFQRKQSSS